ncbi:uncharacterized protein TRIADDRAFT_51750 [Trichoplax adhaerens]|uniref:AB hydrolase-1 domain-containing protein n=1 Tax=Trichoplax adhaerens TaxID=10228 RepID=B3RKS8_TRIAD|nr:hypothetical protein TRIADDRAFT_51750 [Trichoplax adhaerens]EDV28634.1 hypothetical protein TRIADDRAFT_51750 [Trichoplax adhaerens]|eukprot:XP_002107836.1 hypothetical protein TRIADDRAFT_51750 [Trichoplax adhaerens]
MHSGNLSRFLPRLSKSSKISDIRRYLPAVLQFNAKHLVGLAATKSQNFDLPTPFDPEVKFVDVETGNLNVSSVDHIRAGYTDENPNGSPTVITVHGCPGSHYDFRYLATPLRDAGVRIIRINLPGFGPTPKPYDFTYTPVNKANFVGNLLNNIGINRVGMAVGHSMGCACVTSLVSTHPNLVASYALLASCGTRPHFGLRPYMSDKMPHVTYDLTTGISRQLVFHNSGHYPQKFHANHIGKAMLDILNKIDGTKQRDQ